MTSAQQTVVKAVQIRRLEEQYADAIANQDDVAAEGFWVALQAAKGA